MLNVARRTLVAIMLLVIANPAAGDPLRLSVVLSEPGGLYQEFGTQIEMALVDKGIELRVVTADATLPAADLMLAVGMKALARVLDADAHAVVAVLVPRAGYEKLTGGRLSLKHTGKLLTAIYLDQPAARQFALIRALLPKAQTVGIMYSAEPDEIAIFRNQARAHRFDLNERKITSVSAMPHQLQEMLISSEVLLAFPDAEIFNASSIRNILLATYRSRVPLIGFSSAYVRAGALGAVYSRPEQIVSQAAEIVREYAAKNMLPPAGYSREFEVDVNEQVARSLGLHVRNREQVRDEIGKMQ